MVSPDPAFSKIETTTNLTIRLRQFTIQVFSFFPWILYFIYMSLNSLEILSFRCFLGSLFSGRLFISGKGGSGDYHESQESYECSICQLRWSVNRISIQSFVLWSGTDSAVKRMETKTVIVFWKGYPLVNSWHYIFKFQFTLDSLWIVILWLYTYFVIKLKVHTLQLNVSH